MEFHYRFSGQWTVLYNRKNIITNISCPGQFFIVEFNGLNDEKPNLAQSA